MNHKLKEVAGMYRKLNPIVIIDAMDRPIINTQEVLSTWKSYVMELFCNKISR